ncbi:hypothetical protein [Microbacterium lacticum]|nr:hypothetical protein [Microbacterium lacticum]
MDELDDFGVQPRCPECGTVMRSLRRGYWCSTCRLAYVEGIPSNVTR